MSRTFLSIDPGISGTGYALWYEESKKLITSGSLTAKKSDDWLAMGQVICDKLLDVLPKPPNAVVFELPASWGGAAAVSTRSGAVVKLAVMSGLICGNLHYKYKCDLIPVPVNTWKGQLPKEICNRRVEAIMNFKPGKTTHELDAIGIGLWTLGAFK